jgi:taurine dioxygenase
MAQALAWRQLAPFGVEVEHDLSQPLSPEASDQLRGLLYEHGLILARGQRLTMQQQQEICGLFGPILLREGEDGYMSNEGGGAAASELNWHADANYTEHPFDALSLHALDVVDDASSTRFVRCDVALPAELASELEGREQEMIAPDYTMLGEMTCDRRDPTALRRGVMPTFYTNPHNGKTCVWVSALNTTRILDMDWEYSRGLLHEVFEHLYAPSNMHEHLWRKGDLIIWDNIALQHSRGNLETVGPRLLQRVIVGTHGTAPHVAQ